MRYKSSNCTRKVEEVVQWTCQLFQNRSFPDPVRIRQGALQLPSQYVMLNERDDAQWKMLVMVQGDGNARETSTWNGVQNIKKGVLKLKPREEWE
jgi:hypothetical protein